MPISQPEVANPSANRAGAEQKEALKHHCPDGGIYRRLGEPCPMQDLLLTLP